MRLCVCQPPRWGRGAPPPTSQEATKRQSINLRLHRLYQFNYYLNYNTGQLLHNTVILLTDPSLPNRKSQGAEMLRKYSPPLYFICHMSRVTCQVSRVTYHVSLEFFYYFLFFFFLLDKVVKLVGGGSVINRPVCPLAR